MRVWAVVCAFALVAPLAVVADESPGRNSRIPTDSQVERPAKRGYEEVSWTPSLSFSKMNVHVPFALYDDWVILVDGVVRFPATPGKLVLSSSPLVPFSPGIETISYGGKQYQVADGPTVDLFLEPGDQFFIAFYIRKAATPGEELRIDFSYAEPRGRYNLHAESVVRVVVKDGQLVAEVEPIVHVKPMGDLDPQDYPGPSGMSTTTSNDIQTPFGPPLNGDEFGGGSGSGSGPKTRLQGWLVQPPGTHVNNVCIYCLIRVWDKDVFGGPEYLASGYTTVQGWFDIEVANSDQLWGIDPFLQAVTANDGIILSKPDGETYGVQTEELASDCPDGICWLGHITLPIDDALSIQRAFDSYSSIGVAWSHFSLNGPHVQSPRVLVRYPMDNERIDQTVAGPYGAHFHRDPSQPYFAEVHLGSQGFDQYTGAHEYGHFIRQMTADLGIYFPLQCGQHALASSFPNTTEGRACAFEEGWGDFIPLEAFRTSEYCIGDQCADVEYRDFPGWQSGPAVEGNVAALFLDLRDRDITDLEKCRESFDCNREYSLSTVWAVLDDRHANTVYDYCADWVRLLTLTFGTRALTDFRVLADANTMRGVCPSA